MQAWRIAIVTAMMTAAWTAQVRADECDATAANVHAQNPAIMIGDHSSDDRSVVVTFKNPHVDELTLTCANGTATEPTALTAKANATWPSADFYDVVASAGAVVESSTHSAIRSGSVLCAQRAMAADDNNAVYDINGMRFECTTTSGTGGATRIRISKLQAAQPQ